MTKACVLSTPRWDGGTVIMWTSPPRKGKLKGGRPQYAPEAVNNLSKVFANRAEKCPNDVDFEQVTRQWLDLSRSLE